MTRTLTLVLLFAVPLAAQEKKPKKDEAPPPTVTQLLAETRPAAGFTATIFATPDQANYPVFVSAAADGTLYVSSDQNGSLARGAHMGRIFRLRDTDGDGRADEMKTFVKDVDSPRGLVWDIDRLYVLHPPHISVYIDKDGDGVADEEKVLVKNIAFTFKDRPADHTSNGLTLGIDGWLYAAIGDFGFMEAEGTDGRKLQLRGGGVVRVRPDGTGLELFSYGTRNILEVALSPRLDGFARDNTNDGGGWDVRFHHFTGLEDHGYPKLYKNFADEAVKPIADYGGGSGCGAAWIDDPNWPKQWNDKPYTCDWGRGAVYAHPVKPKGATFIEDGKPTEFVKLPRPTDLDIDGAGRVYVSSWRGGQFNYAGPNIGYIAQVVPKDVKLPAVPDLGKLNAEQLLKLMIETKSQKLRQEAQRRLLREKLDATLISKAQNVIDDSQLIHDARIAAIFLLQLSLGAESQAILIEAGSKDSTLLPWTLRAVTNDERQLKALPDSFLTLCQSAMKSPIARTRRETVMALTRHGHNGNTPLIATCLGDEDPVVAHTVVQGLARFGPTASGVYRWLFESTPTELAHLNATRVLAMMHTAYVVDRILMTIKTEPDFQRRSNLLTALCRLYHKEGPWKGDSWGTRPDTRGPYYQPVVWEETPKIAAALEAALKTADAAELVFLTETMAKNRIRIGDPLGRLIELAEKDAKALPILVAQLAKSEDVPARAEMPLLRAVRTPGPVAVQAIRSLLRLNSEKAYQSALLFAEENPEAGPAIMNAVHRDRFVKSFTGAASRGSAMAVAALLKIAASPASTAESRELATKFVEEAWKTPINRGQVLSAIRASRDHSRALELVKLAESAEPDAGNAKELLKTLKLDPARVKAVYEAKGPKVKSLPVAEVVSGVEKLKGELWRGEQLFTAARCAVCHTVSKDQPLKGPYLGNIAKTYKRKDLAEALLVPGKTIAQGFQTNVFTMESGKVLTGYVTQEAADKVVIRDLEGAEFTLLKSEIDSRKKTDVSMMPEGLLAEMSLLDVASLLDYLESLAAAEKGK